MIVTMAEKLEMGSARLVESVTGKGKKKNVWAFWVSHWTINKIEEISSTESFKQNCIIFWRGQLAEQRQLIMA